MIMKLIEVPDYVAADFNQPPRHPSGKPNAVEQSLRRVYRITADALKDLEHPDWEINERQYHSVNCDEPYGFVNVEGKSFIYIEQRGQRLPIAIFKSSHLAAEYFVWRVSKGSRTIDWSTHLDMEP